MLEDDTSISSYLMNLELAYMEPFLILQYFALVMSYSNRNVSLLNNLAKSGKKVVFCSFTL